MAPPFPGFLEIFRIFEFQPTLPLTFFPLPCAFRAFTASLKFSAGQSEPDAEHESAWKMVEGHEEQN